MFCLTFCLMFCLMFSGNDASVDTQTTLILGLRWLKPDCLSLQDMTRANYIPVYHCRKWLRLYSCRRTYLCFFRLTRLDEPNSLSLTHTQTHARTHARTHTRTERQASLLWQRERHFENAEIVCLNWKWCRTVRRLRTLRMTITTATELASFFPTAREVGKSTSALACKWLASFYLTFLIWRKKHGA